MTNLRAVKVFAVAVLLCATAGCAAGGREEFRVAVDEAESAVHEVVRALLPDNSAPLVETVITECDEIRDGLVRAHVTALLEDVPGDPIRVVADLWRERGLDIRETRGAQAEFAGAQTNSGIYLNVQRVPTVFVDVRASTPCYRP